MSKNRRNIIRSELYVNKNGVNESHFEIDPRKRQPIKKNQALIIAYFKHCNIT